MTPKEFRAQWGDLKQLVQFDPLILARLPLLPSAKRFLEVAGLPEHTDIPFTMEFICTDLPLLSDLDPELAALSQPDRPLRVLAVTRNRAIPQSVYYWCIAEDGVVEYTDRTGTSLARPRFVNSSIEGFAAFLVIMKGCYEWAWAEEEALESQYDDEDERLDAQEEASNTQDVGEVYRQRMIDHMRKVVEELRRADPIACSEADEYLATGKWEWEQGITRWIWTLTIIDMWQNGHLL